MHPRGYFGVALARPCSLLSPMDSALPRHFAPCLRYVYGRRRAMSALLKHPTTQADQLSVGHSDHLASIHLEPRFTPATDSQLLIIETGLRLLSVWAVRAAGSAELAATST